MIYKQFNFFLVLVCLLMLPACQTTPNLNEVVDISRHAINTTISVTYGKNGRLWRLTPSKHAIFVDYSDDAGKTFSRPIQVNPGEQTISAWPENPPAIAISQSGRINVLYYADEEQKSTSFFSYSDDNGKTFSQPVLISDQAKTAMHYMDKMMIDHEDNIYLFWHDLRHHHKDRQHGSGVLSLYYSVSAPDQTSTFNNHFISSAVCSCCRTATAFDSKNKPVILVRMVFPESVRDHALIHMDEKGAWSQPQRITFDNWEIEACPEHGPALAIDSRNRSHLTWFTLGKRRGIFYAQTDDYGLNVTQPMALGNSNRLPSHPDVIALKNRVVLTWKEFDGERTYIQTQESNNRGANWSKARTIQTSAHENGHPNLISNGSDIFVSWLVEGEPHHIVKL